MNLIGIFLNPEVRTGGHRRYLEFFQSVSDKGHNVTLIINNKLDYNFSNINIIRIGVKNSILPFSFLFRLKLQQNIAEIKNNITSLDFVVIHGETHLFSGYYIKKIFNCKLLFALRSNGVVESQIKKKEKNISLLSFIRLSFRELKYLLFERIISRQSDIVAFQSNFDKNSFISRNKIDANKLIVIPGNIGNKWFKNSLKNSNKSKSINNLIFAGAINRRKGIIYLIEAFIKLRNDGYKINLTILGIGDQQNYITGELEKHKTLRYVNFKGRVSNPLEFIRHADLLVLPSIFDSFPDVILEGLHVGTPVIAANSGGISDMLPADCIFNVADSNSLYKMVKQLIDNKSDYLTCKEKQKQFKEKFHFDWADTFINVMEKY